MDFFGQQDQARSKTRYLVVLFILAVACTNLGIYLGIAGVLHVVYAFASLGPTFSNQWLVKVATHFQADGFWNLELLGWVGLLVSVTVGVATALKLYQLSAGGVVVARALGSRLVVSDTNDPAERRLLNVVEEMAVASGIPPPAVYVLDEECGINAFVAGQDTRDAVLAVTFGALKLLNRDELQGLVAHEFSHILNGDMRLNTRLIGWLHGVLGLVLLGRLLTVNLRGEKSALAEERSGPIFHPMLLAPNALGIICLIAGSLGAFMARLIKSAVNRQREYLADAAAVQFTRNPEGLAGALKKVGGLPHLAVLVSPRAEVASHLFFCDGMRKRWLRFLSTHPPLTTRIERIYPYFDGKFPRVSIDQVLRESPLTAEYRNRPSGHAIDIVKLAAVIGPEAAAREALFADAARKTAPPNQDENP